LRRDVLDKEHVVNRRLLAATVASTLAALLIPLLANPAAAHQAMDDAAARALAIVGLVVGALGLMAGVVALTRSHRSSGQAAPTRASEAATAGGRYRR
jgi:hypothetical protein